VEVGAAMFRQEQALARVSLVKEVRESRPEETQAALLAWRFARWLGGVAVLLLLVGAVYVVMTEVSHVVAMTGE
jgi:hypothetical protein